VLHFNYPVIFEHPSYCLEISWKINRFCLFSPTLPSPASPVTAAQTAATLFSLAHFAHVTCRHSCFFQIHCWLKTVYLASFALTFSMSCSYKVVPMAAFERKYKSTLQLFWP